jgi:two-component system C4-dicarboxylate transport response regulator DctD
MRRISVVVDDDPSVRRFITTILRLEDFETVEAEGGNQGLELVRDLGESVDLIVSDIQMPRGDGLSLARAVKESFPSIPIILVSGRAAPEGEYDGFVQKPFASQELLETVRTVVANKVGLIL